MQALCICSSKGGSFRVPQLDSQLGSYSFASTRPRRRYEFNSSVFVWSKLRCSSRNAQFRNPEFRLRNEFLSGCNRLKLIVLCKPDIGHSRFLVGIGNGVLSVEDSSSVDEFSGKIEIENVDNHNSDVVKENVDCVNEDGNGVDSVGGGESAMIDIKALAGSLQFAKTAEDVESVLGGMKELPLEVFSTIIKFYGKEKCLEAAFALVEWLKRKKKESGSGIGPDVVIYNCLLGSVKRAGQYGVVESVLNDMAEEGVVANVVTYNTLMAVYAEQGEAAKAFNVFEEIKEKGLILTPHSYSTALLAYRKMKDADGALKFFVEFREKYAKGEIVKEDEFNWETEFVRIQNYTVDICRQIMRRWLVDDGNMTTSVLNLLTDMDTYGLELRREQYERLAWACTREEHHVVGKELYHRIRERYSDISLSVCNHIIWLLGKAKKWWAALEIYEHMLDEGPRPNSMSYELIVSHFNVLLTAARKRGQWQWGLRMLNKMEEKGLKPGTKELNSVLVACSKASETSSAIQIFERMVDQGEKPTIISYGALLSVLEKGNLYDEALRVWDHMIKVRMKPNIYAYTILASVHAGKGDFQMVDEVLKEMAEAGIEPTVVTLNAIISACARNGMTTTAYEWLHRMKDHKISPNAITYEMLIDALAKDGKPKLAYELYLRANNEALILSSKAHDAIVLASQALGASIDFSLLGPPDNRKKMQTRITD